MITSLPGGTLAEMLGGRNVAGYSCLLGAILTALTPVAAAWDKYAVFAVRFLIGLVSGVVYPCCHNLVSKWSPPEEKGKFVASLMGGTFGTVITWPLCGLLIESLGWDWAFYVVALIVLVIVALWFYLVSDTPATHSSISLKEREFIENSLGNTLAKKAVGVFFYCSFVELLKTSSLSFTWSEMATIQAAGCFYALLGANIAALRQHVGSIFPHNRNAKVFERGPWLWSLKGWLPVQFATHCSPLGCIWFRFRCGLDPSQGLVDDDVYQKDVLLAL